MIYYKYKQLLPNKWLNYTLGFEWHSPHQFQHPQLDCWHFKPELLLSVFWAGFSIVSPVSVFLVVMKAGKDCCSLHLKNLRGRWRKNTGRNIGSAKLLLQRLAWRLKTIGYWLWSLVKHSSAWRLITGQWHPSTDDPRPTGSCCYLAQ